MAPIIKPSSESYSSFRACTPKQEQIACVSVFSSVNIPLLSDIVCKTNQKTDVNRSKLIWIYQITDNKLSL